MALNERGSEWHKWDLHVHTPYSHVSNYGDPNSDATWERFIADLETLPPEYKVLGINDYYFIEGYKRLREAKARNGRLANIDLLLPVVELRIRNFSGSSELRKINFHVIFSDKINIHDIEQNFLGRLELEYMKDGQSSWKRFFSRSNLEEFGQKIIDDAPAQERAKFGSPFITGANNATFDLERMIEFLKHNTFEGAYFTAIGKAEWESHAWAQAIADKKRLINGASLIFTASPTPQDCLNSRKTLRDKQVNSKVFHCSDSHSFSDSNNANKIGHCFTWVKADTEFVGLKYALEDYESRVFVGEIPPKVALVRDRPTKFIDAIEIRKKPNSNLNEVWFNHNIKLNADLVAIVGNKGSGKSALADIIGLLGNTHNSAYFSFLSEERFRDPKGRKAQHFFGRLHWFSGSDSPRDLDQEPDPNDFEKVKYLPQRYLERICNEIGGGKETEFDREIKNVIFSHIPRSEKIGKFGFDDLVKYKTEEANKRIQQLKIDLSQLNKQIAELEIRSTPEEIEKIKNLIKKKQGELEAHDRIKPPQVSPPVANEANQKVNQEIESKQSQLNKSKAEIEKVQSEKNRETIRLAQINKLLEMVEGFATYAADFQDSLGRELSSFGLSASQIVEVRITSEPLKKVQKQSFDKLSACEQSLTSKPGSLQGQFENLNSQIEELRKKLDEPNQKYQAYVKALANWEGLRKAIEGAPDQPDSLKFYEHQLNLTNSLAEEMKVLRAQRVSTVKRIYSEIQRLAGVLKSYYEPVKAYIENSDSKVSAFDFQFSVEISVGNFADQLIEWIDSRVSGSFSGVDGRKTAIATARSYDFSSEDQVIRFLSDVYQKLNTVPSPTKKHVIRQQLRSNKSLEEFYDFLFSLDYLRPKYSLKSGERELSQLSPGQKGLLLLSFYLVVDKSDIPLVIDQPEENLDNHTVFDLLVPYIERAKERRQIVIVTHNPNLAVVCDAEQIVWCSLSLPDGNRISYESGSIENGIVNKRIVDVLEGTHRAFSKRRRKYLIPEL